MQPIDSSGVRDIPELIARLEDAFHCMDGPQSSSFTVVDSSHRDSARVEYVTLAFATPAHEISETAAEALLATLMHDAIVAAGVERSPLSTLLFWRVRPRLTLAQTYLSTDVCGRTQEQCEDLGVSFEPALGPRLYYLRARLAIPGFRFKDDYEGQPAQLV